MSGALGNGRLPTYPWKRGDVLGADELNAAIALGGGLGGGVQVTISDTPPASPVAGDLWYDSYNCELNIWYTDPNSSQWVTANNSSFVGNYLSITGGTLTGSLYINGALTVSGTTTAPTPVSTDNSTNVATTQFVKGQLTSYLPTTGGTISGNLSVTGTATITGNTTISGTLTAPTPAPTDNSTKAATTSFVKNQLTGYLPLGGGTLSGNLVVNYLFAAGTTGVTDMLMGPSGALRSLQWATGYTDSLNTTTHDRIFYRNSTIAMYIAGSDGSLYLNQGTAYKPSAGGWTGISDIRAKEDVRPYTSGLDVVCALEPIVYQYNGYGGSPRDGKHYHGLSAQAAQQVMPELVTPIRDDLLGTELTPLTLALVNAVRELRDEVVELRRRLDAI